MIYGTDSRRPINRMRMEQKKLKHKNKHTVTNSLFKSFLFGDFSMYLSWDWWIRRMPETNGSMEQMFVCQSTWAFKFHLKSNLKQMFILVF